MIAKRKSIAFAIFASLLLCSFALRSLYARKPLSPSFDAAYCWADKSLSVGQWLYEELPTGHKYYLYLPEKYRDSADDESAKLPLFVTFHGSGEKYRALKYGKIFTDSSFQKKIAGGRGAAVLVPLSRIDYFTDAHSMSLLIQNVVLKNKCIDAQNIIGYGFSQGAAFVVELACRNPRLFKVVVSGSGFYRISARELLGVLGVSFYSAISEDDKGIFEQGHTTGKLLGFFCRNSRYVQYKSRRHFFLELKDESGKFLPSENRNETLEDWLIVSSGNENSVF